MASNPRWRPEGGWEAWSGLVRPVGCGTGHSRALLRSCGLTPAQLGGSLSTKKGQLLVGQPQATGPPDRQEEQRGSEGRGWSRLPGVGPLRAAWGPCWHVLRRPCIPTLLDICSLRSLRKRDKPQDGAPCSVPVSSAAGPQP